MGVKTGKILAVSAMAIGLLVMTVGASAEPQGPWVLPATDLSATGRSAIDPQIAIAPDGSATAVWLRFDGSHNIVQAATRPPGGAFGAPVDLSAAGGYAFDPQIAVAADGGATAVWCRNNGTHLVIQASTRPPGGSFGAPVNLSAADWDACQPQIAIAPDGTATVVWYRSAVGGDFITQAVTRAPGGSFDDPVTIGEYGFRPQIAIAPDGTSTVVWSQPEGSFVSRIRATTRPPGGTFGFPAYLWAGGQRAFDPQISIASDGTATVVWTQDNGTDEIIQASTRRPGDSFGGAVDLSDTGEDASTPQLVTAPDGTTTAVWCRYDGTNEIIQAATRPPGGDFGTPVDLSAAGHDAFDPQIATAPDGSATVVWRRSDGSRFVIQSATRLHAGTFGSPVDLSASGQDASEPQIAIDSDNGATAIWDRFDGTDDIIQSASTAPSLLLLKVAKSGSRSGRVTSTPGGIDCGSDCSKAYPVYTKVTLTAVPNPGSTFKGWSGGSCSGKGVCEVAMLQGTTVTAGFGKPAIAAPRPRPKVRKVRPGKKTSFNVKVRNTGDGVVRNLKVCGKGPKKLVRFSKCAKKSSLAPGKTFTAKFRLKVKKKAKKGRRTRVSFAATALGLRKKTGKATVRVK